MKSLYLRVAAVLVLFAAVASGAPAFLRVGNKFGDYWIYRFSGNTVNVRFNLDRSLQKQSDREIRITDIDLTFGGLPVSQIASRFEGSNLAKIRLLCKQPGCVYSHFDSNKYDELDIVCELEQDGIAFVQSVITFVRTGQ